MTKQTFLLTVENSDIAAEQLEELIEEALDGEPAVDDSQPITVGVDVCGADVCAIVTAGMATPRSFGAER